MKKWSFVVGVLMAAAGCTKPNPALSCEDGLCSDPTVPYCDVTGSISGEPNTCIHVSCTANEFVECRGDKALTCNATGDSYDLLSCAYGCDENGCKAPPPCDTLECQKHIIPKYLPTECDTLASTDLTISANTTLDTSDMTKCTSIVTQPGAPELCVMHYATVTIERNQTLTVKGSRALALVADRRLLVDGIVDVGGKTNTNGAGAALQPSGTTMNNTKAGGGAGYRTAGAAGGTTSTDGGAANGGAATPNPATLAVLAGGSRADVLSRGGGGGGGVTLVSCRDQLSIPGVIDAGGGGGVGGQSPVSSGPYDYAGGGGAGGTIVLQGKMVSVTGQLFANGGGGGGGGTFGGTGENGLRSVMPAKGGLDSGFGSTNHTGGNGGTDEAPDTGKASSPGAGAGGGAAGYILVYVPTGTAPTVTAAAMSPAVEPTAFIATN